MGELLNLGYYRLGDYYQRNTTRSFFKIVYIPDEDHLRIKSIHTDRTYLLHIDEFGKKFTRVNLSYIGLLSKHLVNEINDLLRRNKETLKELSKSVLPKK